MEDDEYIFQASGDACPVCKALDGTVTTAGFTAHENCQCQTVLADGKECEWSYSHAGNNRYGSGSLDVVAGIEVEVVCPDGETFGISTQVDLGTFGGDLDAAVEAFQEAAEEAAEELCGQCSGKNPDLVC